VAGPHPFDDRPAAGVAAGGVGDLDQRPAPDGAEQVRKALFELVDQVVDEPAYT
jgi:hypothetical protein